jgi:hypothetical protein
VIGQHWGDLFIDPAGLIKDHAELAVHHAGTRARTTTNARVQAAKDVALESGVPRLFSPSTRDRPIRARRRSCGGSARQLSCPTLEPAAQGRVGIATKTPAAQHRGIGWIMSRKAAISAHLGLRSRQVAAQDFDHRGVVAAAEPCTAPGEV